MKTCSNCGRRKALASFFNNNRSSDGKGSWCKQCNKGMLGSATPKAIIKYRPCIGILCREQKNFKSINGARICNDCKEATKNYSNQDDFTVTARR